jgi:hypothetical protein
MRSLALQRKIFRQDRWNFAGTRLPLKRYCVLGGGISVPEMMKCAAFAAR